MKQKAKPAKTIKAVKPETPAPVQERKPAAPKTQHYGSETRLQVGDVIKLSDGEYAVWMVNDCRAACIPLSLARVQFETLAGQTVEYAAASRQSVNISPNSDCEIVRRLGKQGLVEFLEQQKQQRKAENMSKKEKSSKKNEGPRLGKLGGFLGHPITGVIRAMAKAGWEYWECRAAFDKAGIKVADNTIRIQLSAGRNDEAPPAPVDKAELKKIRPDESEKPQRGEAKSEKKSKKNKDKGGKKDKGSKSEKKDKGNGKAKSSSKQDEDEDEGPEDIDA